MQIQGDKIIDKAANGLIVAIPKDQYPKWRKAQDEMLKTGVTKYDQEIVEKLNQRFKEI